VPFEMVKGADVWLPILSVACRLERKDETHMQTFVGKPLLEKTLTAWAGLILSKNPDISKRRRAPA
jgi:hypothetical protein